MIRLAVRPNPPTLPRSASCPGLRFRVAAGLGVAVVTLSLVTPAAGAATAARPQASPPTGPGASVGELVESGRQALDGDRAEAAIPLLRQALERIESSAGPDPVRTAEVEALLGRALVLTDHYAEAADHLARAVSLGRGDVGTLLYLGSAQWESQQLEPAVESLRRAADLAAGTLTGSGADFLAHHQLGRLLLWMGRAGDAVEPLERAVSLRGDAFDARLDLARALDRSGALERAVTVYGQALEMNPSSHHAQWGMAQALLRLGRRDEAREHLAVYRRLYEENKERTQKSILTDARMARARELFSERKLDEAEQIVAALPETAETLEALARIRATAGNLGGAVAALERAVSIAPDRDDLRRLLAEARLLAQEASNGG